MFGSMHAKTNFIIKDAGTADANCCLHSVPGHAYKKHFMLLSTALSHHVWKIVSLTIWGGGGLFVLFLFLLLLVMIFREVGHISVSKYGCLKLDGE